MKTPEDSVLATIAALFVLFTAMIDPRISTLLGVGLLLAFVIYKVIENQTHQSQH